MKLRFYEYFNKQLEKQYNDMPDVFKNIFSCDEFGNLYQIRNIKEVKESQRNFFDSFKRFNRNINLKVI